MKVIGKDKPFEIEVKKLYLPFIIKDIPCECGNIMERNYRDEPLSYPTVNEPIKDYLYCNKCNTEYTFEIKLALGLEVVSGPVKE